MFVLDFVTAVSAAEEEEKGERGRRTVEALGERQSDPLLAALMRRS